MWTKIKAFAGKCWNGIKHFVLKHFHKVAAIATAGLFMITVEVLGFLAADILLYPLAMVSIFGLIGLCFAYFLVMVTAIMGGMEIFDTLWNKLQYDFSIKKEKSAPAEDSMNSTDAELAAEMSHAKA